MYAKCATNTCASDVALTGMETYAREATLSKFPLVALVNLGLPAKRKDFSVRKESLLLLFVADAAFPVFQFWQLKLKETCIY